MMSEGKHTSIATARRVYRSEWRSWVRFQERIEKHIGLKTLAEDSAQICERFVSGASVPVGITKDVWRQVCVEHWLGEGI